MKSIILSTQIKLSYVIHLKNKAVHNLSTDYLCLESIEIFHCLMSSCRIFQFENYYEYLKLLITSPDDKELFALGQFKRMLKCHWLHISKN